MAVDGAAYDVNKYACNVLLLQRTTDKIVMLSMSKNQLNNLKKRSLIYIRLHFLYTVFIYGFRGKFSAAFCKILVNYPNRRLITFQLR